MKKIMLVCAAMLSFGTYTANAQNTFPHKWNVGLSMGFGIAKDDGFMMNSELGYSHLIKDTRFRWGVNVGIMNPGITDFEWDDTDDVFMYHSYNYPCGYVDYAFLTVPNMALYLHGALAPCWWRETYSYHYEDKFTIMPQLGIGMDVGYVRMAMNGYATLAGDAGFLFSIGFYFGK